MGKQQSEGLGGFVHLVERQMLLHEERRKLIREHVSDEPAGPYRFITISRDIGALGDAVASELAARLKWRVYDKEIVEYIAKHSHVRRSLADQLDERTQSLIHDSVDRLLGMFQGQSFGNEEYHVALIKTLATLAAQGRTILLGHGGAFALQDQPALHVRITAGLPIRVQRMSKRWSLPLEETRRRVLKADAERQDFVRHHFKSDLNDFRFFHLVFNTNRFSVDQIVAAIIGVLAQSAESHPVDFQVPAFESFAFRNSEQDAAPKSD